GVRMGSSRRIICTPALSGKELQRRVAAACAAEAADELLRSTRRVLLRIRALDGVADLLRADRSRAHAHLAAADRDRAEPIAAERPGRTARRRRRPRESRTMPRRRPCVYCPSTSTNCASAAPARTFRAA